MTRSECELLGGRELGNCFKESDECGCCAATPPRPNTRNFVTNREACEQLSDAGILGAFAFDPDCSPDDPGVEIPCICGDAPGDCFQANPDQKGCVSPECCAAVSFVLPDCCFTWTAECAERAAFFCAPCTDDDFCKDRDVDGDPCTVGKCDPASGICIVVDKDCSDGNPCTDDSCNPATPNGDCVNVPVSGTEPCCFQDEECPDDGNPCTREVCNKLTNRCENEEVLDCCRNDDQCDDGDLCTQDVCINVTGTCVSLDIQCDDQIFCTTDICNPLTGECVFLRRDADGGRCDDGDPCTENICNELLNGFCENPPKTCDDNNACTTDSCDPQTGECRNVVTVVCDDEKPCTDDSCDPTNGACLSIPISGTIPCCDMDNPCLDDGNPCTQEFCDPITNTCMREELPGCCRTSADCLDDGEFCNGIQACLVNFCIEINACGVNQICDEANRRCLDSRPCTRSEQCDDGVLCNGFETCVGFVCRPGAPPCRFPLLCSEDFGCFCPFGALANGECCTQEQDDLGICRDFGDANGDNLLDIDDFFMLTLCAGSGRDRPLSPDCIIFDFNRDGQIDMFDFGNFFLAFFGEFLSD